jgi:hypothetical protein
LWRGDGIKEKNSDNYNAIRIPATKFKVDPDWQPKILHSYSLHMCKANENTGRCMCMNLFKSAVIKESRNGVYIKNQIEVYFLWKNCSCYTDELNELK